LARYTGASCRTCRRENLKLFLKGDRCYSDKCSFERRSYSPGQHGQNRFRKVSDYAIQLREKQKVKHMYGMLENQFRRYFHMADQAKGVTGENLLVMLERRLDNVVFRMGLASSRAQARQLVTHGHIMVNGHKVDIASYSVRPGDVITIKDRSRKSPYFKELAEDFGKKQTPPKWISVNPDELSATVVALPEREDIDITINEQLIVEYYSR